MKTIDDFVGHEIYYENAGPESTRYYISKVGVYYVWTISYLAGTRLQGDLGKKYSMTPREANETIKGYVTYRIPFFCAYCENAREDEGDYICSNCRNSI